MKRMQLTNNQRASTQQPTIQQSIDKPNISIDKPKMSIDKPRKQNNKFEDLIKLKNDFFKFLGKINENDYPLNSSVIRRIQKYKRYSLIEDCVELFLIFLKEQKRDE